MHLQLVPGQVLLILALLLVILLLFLRCTSTVLAAALNELGHGLQGPLTIVVNNLIAVLGEVLEGGEALDLDRLDLVGGGVHLGNHNILTVLELGAKLVPDGGQLLAVSAPRGIELDENTLGLVESDLIEVLADQDLDRLGIPVLRHILGHQVGLDLAVKEVLDKGLDGLSVKGGRLGLELGHVLRQLDETHSGDLVVLEAEELGDAAVLLIGGVQVDEENLALESTSGSLESLKGVLTALLLQEQQDVVLHLTTEDLLGRLLGKLDDKRQLVLLHKLGNLIGGDLAIKVVTSLIELLEENNTILLHLVLGEDSIIRGDAERNVINARSSLLESNSSLALLTLEETNNNNIILVSHLLGILHRLDVSSRRSSLLLQPVDDISSLAASTIVTGFTTVTEELDGGVSTDTILRGKVVLNGGINLGQP